MFYRRSIAVLYPESKTGVTFLPTGEAPCSVTCVQEYLLMTIQTAVRRWLSTIAKEIYRAPTSI